MPKKIFACGGLSLKNLKHPKNFRLRRFSLSLLKNTLYFFRRLRISDPQIQGISGIPYWKTLGKQKWSAKKPENIAKKNTVFFSKTFLLLLSDLQLAFSRFWKLLIFFRNHNYDKSGMFTCIIIDPTSSWNTWKPYLITFSVLGAGDTPQKNRLRRLSLKNLKHPKNFRLRRFSYLRIPPLIPNPPGIGRGYS